MKKPKKIKKPKLPKIGRPLKGVSRLAVRRRKTTEEKVSDALSNVPRITNETVGEHREEVLSSARKYIYPLQHSKYRVVRISLGLFALVVIAFFAFCGLALYKFQMTSGFIYDVTRVVPFPVAKTGNTWVGYESYLFELRRNMHYYHTQQQANFSTRDGQTQLKRLKQQALGQVTQDAYVKQLAAENHVSVSDQAVTDELNLLKNENRLGSSSRALRDSLNAFFGWNENDLKRELKKEMLAQAVVAKLDTTTNDRAKAALRQLVGGADFGGLAGQVSDDAATKGNGGQYPSALTLNDGQVPPAVTAELFRLKPGQVSGIINTGYSLDIAKQIDASGSSVHAAHIQFNFQPITTYVKPLQAKEPARYYIKP
ncbi:MAG TPA: peptidylprolyl isomerase [Candidatus Dormibacteraeota bacterium]|nr:peptidylprolyl isomerase [Candidatus Dormibacteraeota bacterium]